jgi:hypothetical protein
MRSKEWFLTVTLGARHGNELMIYDGLENVMDGKGGVGGRYPLYKSNFVLNKSNSIPKTFEHLQCTHLHLNYLLHPYELEHSELRLVVSVLGHSREMRHSQDHA